MPGEWATKLRLVRCPKCRLLLPELPHYNVYKCGGCGTTLQAKIRKSKDVNPGSSLHGSVKTPGNTSDLVSEDTSSKKEQLVSYQKNVERTTTTPDFSAELSLDDNCKKSQYQNGPRENDLGTKATECSSVENAGRDQNEHGECNGEQLEISNLSDEDMENEMDVGEHSDMKINRHEVSNKCCSIGLTRCEIVANDANLQLAESEESDNKNLLSKGTEEELYSTSTTTTTTSLYPTRWGRLHRLQDAIVLYHLSNF
ncbi:protein ENHANCED DISEASE RESISTANCE 4 [Prosopis cineraria]|uniref:protein ENHANCED DISEASE RESISTANCE 4 n=1 Tax=Prosopis cineraria TaxID=364024 RepID=UPI00240F8168|nr:protein ENHANCED DISEASE RESISTANCE 4 [Prosopis cineraria]XP_054788680.1 protein ENHANCED DISEASE RESISTANCE 4 [Prosopis cineraria]